MIGERSVLLYQSTRRAMNINVAIIVRYHCYQRSTKSYAVSSQTEAHMKTKLSGITTVGFDITDNLLVRFLAFVKY
jgi:hypothetical protein